MSGLMTMHEYRAAQAAEMAERELQDAVMALGRYLGYRCYHTHDSRRSEPGFPDLVLARPGRVVVAELKRETGRLTDDQQDWLERLGGAGIECHIWRPSDYLDGRIEEVLR
jgi:hypothetical protein